MIIQSEHVEKVKVSGEMGRAVSGTSQMKDEVSVGAEGKEYQMKRSPYHVLPSLRRDSVTWPTILQNREEIICQF